MQDLQEKDLLLPERHPQSELFICDISDAVVKDDMASMEHPIFVLTKQPYTKRRRYQHGDNWFEIVPSDKGVANIWDKDILIFAISQIMAAKNAGRPYSRNISFTAYDFLVFSNRVVNGQSYSSLKDALERLDGTRLRTNIKTGGEEEWRAFGLIDGAMIRRKTLDGRVLEWGLTLSEWLFKAIECNEVLTLNPYYFRLKKPLERRLYEVARKHCGNKRVWRIGIDLLQKKCGSTSPRRNFRGMLKKISEHEYFPDYQVQLIDDTIVFTPKEYFQILNEEIEDRGKTKIPPLAGSAYEQFRKLYPNTDPYEIEEQWRYWARNKEAPKNPEGSFLNFARKHFLNKNKGQFQDNQGNLW